MRNIRLLRVHISSTSSLLCPLVPQELLIWNSAKLCTPRGPLLTHLESCRNSAFLREAVYRFTLYISGVRHRIQPNVYDASAPSAARAAFTESSRGPISLSLYTWYFTLSPSFVTCLNSPHTRTNTEKIVLPSYRRSNALPNIQTPLSSNTACSYKVAFFGRKKSTHRL
jgi:hypothetical protein